MDCSSNGRAVTAPMDHKKDNSRGQNEFNTKSLLCDIIALKIQVFVISVDHVSDPLFEERCRQCEMSLNVALRLLLFLEVFAS
ncbi:hypothetical protein AVEN_237412-1 [Araneus ventricosus]|uniref:Uncharacterized protein n=1 Tax=Araneus ventricosus TaxID=182803 RepID=A0A4Y2PT65_ARAVE|nr:hypothetical protein AVEN_237412-1 [Araneus ventricosus]